MTAGRPAAYRGKERGRSTIRNRARTARIATCRWWLRKIRAISAARFIPIVSPPPIPPNLTRIKIGHSLRPPRSFWSQNCAVFHMPMVASQDPGNIGGQVHSHRFPAANTAVPYANEDQSQLELTKKFLTSGFISVDIFAVSPANDHGTAMIRRTGEGPHAMTGFAVGEEAEQSGNAVIREVGQVAAPIDHLPDFAD